MVSRPCDNCRKVKRCRMIVTSAGVEYVCTPCWRELNAEEGDDDVTTLHATSSTDLEAPLPG